MPEDSLKFHLSIRKIANATLVFSFLIILTLIGRDKPPETAQHPDGRALGEAKAADFNDPCSRDQSYNCYRAALTQYITKVGLKPAVEQLGKLNSKNQTVNHFCHSLAHDLGRAAYDQTKGNIGQIFREGNTQCWSGFYHGALERAFSRSQDLSVTVNSLCTEENGIVGTFLYYQCLHGLGHGLSVRFDNEIYQALDVCQKMPDTYQQSSCFGGVFMENFAADGINHQTKYLDPTDPIAPCNSVPENQKYTCYQLISIPILKANNYNFQEAFNTCEKSETNYVKVCYQSVGRDISGYTAEDPNRSLGYCAQGNLEAEIECIKAVASDSVYSKSSEKYVLTICEKVKSSLKNYCYLAAGSGINVLYNSLEDKREACQLFPSQYRQVCENQLTS